MTLIFRIESCQRLTIALRSFACHSLARAGMSTFVTACPTSRTIGISTAPRA